MFLVYTLRVINGSLSVPLLNQLLILFAVKLDMF